jgi:hypothetical protein
MISCVGRASARRVGLKPYLQKNTFYCKLELLNTCLRGNDDPVNDCN